MPEEELHHSPHFGKLEAKKGRKALNPQTKELILSVVKFMQLEANGEFVISPKKVQCRAAAATGFSERTVRRVVKESKSLPVIVSSSGENKPIVFPSKKPPNRSKPKTGLDALTRSMVRKIIHKFYVHEKTVPTIKKVYQKLVEEIGFKGSTRSAHQIIKEVGFIWKKTKSKSFILIEKHDIRLKRIEYIRNIIKYRHEGRPIIYVGSVILSNSNFENRKASEKRVLVIHAGGDCGLLPNGLALFQIEKTASDYHHSLIDQYCSWFKNTLLPCFPPKTILVLDSVIYQSIQSEKIPTLNSNTEDMKKWLISKNIPFQDHMLRPELHQIIKKHASKFKKDGSIIQQFLNERGHSILKLPPNHSDLNFIDVVLAEMKSQMVSINICDIDNLMTLCQDTLNKMTGDIWLSICNHVKNLEQQYLDNETIIDAEIEKIISKSTINKCVNYKDTFLNELVCEYDLSIMKSFMNGFLGLNNN